jgi:glycosyltransferase involved in cell wall biosynthesis
MIKNKPFFSIIIPSLNEEKYLPKLLTDLSNQTFKDFEVIVVDGKSTDHTVSKAREFAKILPSLKVITSNTRHVCAQRNLGAKEAQADILIFSDADNRLPPYFLQGIKYRYETTESDLMSPYFIPDIKTRQNETIANAINTFFDLQMSIKPRFLLESLIIVTHKAFNSIKGFDETINFAEGKSLIQNIVAKGYTTKIIKDPEYTFSFRRLRKYGIINIAGRVAKLELAELLGSEFKQIQQKKLYPMLGGTLFSKPKKAKNKFLKNIQKILKDF